MARLRMIVAIFFGYVLGLLTTSTNQMLGSLRDYSTINLLVATSVSSSSPVIEEVHLVTPSNVSNTERKQQANEQGAVPPMFDEGWKDIHIFVGDRENNTIVREFSRWGDGAQWGQDEVVMALLNRKRNGYFIDLAANHAKALSNTFQLEKQLDWNGLCIEPNERYWESHKERRCRLISAVVSGKAMEYVQFRMHDGMKGPSGGIVGNDFDHKPGALRQGFASKPFFTVTIFEIFQRFQVPNVIDYFSLDVEGAELVVMQSFPFEDYKIRILTIERPRQALIDLLYEKGYVYLASFQSRKQDETLFAHSSTLDGLNRTIVDTSMNKGTTKILTIRKSDKPIAKS